MSKNQSIQEAAPPHNGNKNHGSRAATTNAHRSDNSLALL